MPRNDSARVHAKVSRRRSAAHVDGLESRRLMTTFTVNNAANAGTGSLRWAIEQANLTPAADAIHFALPSSQTISLTTALPAITAPVTIDGSTQPGYEGQPRVGVSGFGLPSGSDGFNVNASNVTLRGLSITHFPAAGVDVSSSGTAFTLRECFVGVQMSGSVSAANGVGVSSNASNTKVRDSVISGNTLGGIRFFSGLGSVTGSTIGLAVNKSTALPNNGYGVQITGGTLHAISDNVIGSNAGWGVYAGGTAALVTINENVIGTSGNQGKLAANGEGGVYLNNVSGTVSNNVIAAGGTATGVRVSDYNGVSILNNKIGIGVPVALDLGGGVGIYIADADLTEIRGNEIGHWNTGVLLKDANGTELDGNFIGTTKAYAFTQVGNGIGVDVQNGYYNDIGTDASPNTIAYNDNQGVWIRSGTGNPILGNVFRSNGGLDIDLGAAGITANDSWDADTGANNLQNTTAWTYVSAASETARIQLNTAGAGQYRLDLYRVNDYKAGGVGAGNQLISSQVHTLPGPTLVDQYFTYPAQIDGTRIAYTVTRIINGIPTDTSEFSMAARIESNPYIHEAKFDRETDHTVRFRFSRDVSASIGVGDLSVLNLGTNQTLVPSSVQYDAATHTANFRFATKLSAGNYKATLNTSSVYSPVQILPGWVENKTAVGTSVLNFHFLPGDANNDKKVDFSDLVILAQNYNQGGKTFSSGNFNYDAQGKVDFSDLVILAQNYNQSLASLPSAVTSTPAGKSEKSRVAASVLN